MPSGLTTYPSLFKRVRQRNGAQRIVWMVSFGYGMLRPTSTRSRRTIVLETHARPVTRRFYAELSVAGAHAGTLTRPPNSGSGYPVRGVSVSRCTTCVYDEYRWKRSSCSIEYNKKQLELRTDPTGRPTDSVPVSPDSARARSNSQIQTHPIH